MNEKKALDELAVLIAASQSLHILAQGSLCGHRNYHYAKFLHHLEMARTELDEAELVEISHVSTSMDAANPVELDFDAKGEIRDISSDCAIVREYEIWSNGYEATGEHETAILHGKMTGKSFNEACIRFFEMKDSDFRNGKDAEDASLFDAERLTYWGCRLFPTEAEARKSFG